MKPSSILTSLLFLFFGASNTQAQTSEIFIFNENNINSAFQEYSPAFHPEGLVFVATNPAVDKEKTEDSKTGTATTSIFISKRDENNRHSRPMPFAQSLTTTYYDGPLCFSKDGKRVFITRSNLKKGKPVKAKDGLVKLKIYSAELKDSVWANLTELPFNDKEFDNAHPSVSADGRRLYFTSNRTGGFGGMDLYVSTFIDGQWSDPVNLGPKINTDKNEIFPFISPDGKLFFASNGHKGIGNLDIFTTMRTDTGWLMPLVLPEPINSRSDDFGLITTLNKKTGYFSSNRASGKGDDDIFSFESAEAIDIQRVIAPDTELMAVETSEFKNEATASTASIEPVTTEPKPSTPSVSAVENTPKTSVEPSRKESDKMENDGFDEPKVEVVKVEIPTEIVKTETPNLPVKPEMKEDAVKNKTERVAAEFAEPTENQPLVSAKPQVETPKFEPITTEQKVGNIKPVPEIKPETTPNSPSEFASVDSPDVRKTNVEFVKNTSESIETTVTARVEPKIKPLETDSPRVASVSLGITPESLAEGTTRVVENTNATEKPTETKAENTPSVSAVEIKIEKPKSENNLLKSSTLGKKYLVVVGTYATRANAAIQLKKAQTKGFTDAVIVHYEDRNLFAVSVKQFDKSAEAYGFAKNITKEKSLECFVKELK